MSACIESKSLKGKKMLSTCPLTCPLVHLGLSSPPPLLSLPLLSVVPPTFSFHFSFSRLLFSFSSHLPFSLFCSLYSSISSTTTAHQLFLNPSTQFTLHLPHSHTHSTCFPRPILFCSVHFDPVYPQPKVYTQLAPPSLFYCCAQLLLDSFQYSTTAAIAIAARNNK
ncbi:MAG: hypothetical protein J3R72DRAFT_462173 [Linnemannia gamsii]|nr:MAG: hypothetical protein J3R72DRAFT_462173 [Linnemannia gamsii]